MHSLQSVYCRRLLAACCLLCLAGCEASPGEKVFRCEDVAMLIPAYPGSFAYGVGLTSAREANRLLDTPVVFPRTGNYTLRQVCEAIETATGRCVIIVPVQRERIDWAIVTVGETSTSVNAEVLPMKATVRQILTHLLANLGVLEWAFDSEHRPGRASDGLVNDKDFYIGYIFWSAIVTDDAFVLFLFPRVENRSEEPLAISRHYDPHGTGKREKRRLDPWDEEEAIRRGVPVEELFGEKKVVPTEKSIRE
jgi:hypothetical protein